MKSYLSKFANQGPRIKDKSIEPVPPEPPKGAFGGFGGTPPVLLSNIQSACEAVSNTGEGADLGSDLLFATSPLVEDSAPVKVSKDTRTDARKALQWHYVLNFDWDSMPASFRYYRDTRAQRWGV